MSAKGWSWCTLALAAAALLLNTVEVRRASLVCGGVLLVLLVLRLSRHCPLHRFGGASDPGEDGPDRARLETELADAEQFLNCVPSILIGLDPAGRLNRWNPAAVNFQGLDPERASGQTLDGCGIQWVRPNMAAEIARWLETAAPSHRSPDIPYRKDDKVRLLGVEVHRITRQNRTTGFILTGADLTERRSLEVILQQAQRLETVGQLAAGIAHEINTPIQYVGDNVRFLRDSFQTVQPLLAQYEQVRQAAEHGTVPGGALQALAEALETADMAYLAGEIPNALAQSLEGVERVATIVGAMKEFAHPGRTEKGPADLNKALFNTLIVARNEVKHVADVETHFGILPPVVCNRSEMNQVFLNLLVNAAHAVEEVVRDTRGRGKITVRTWEEGHHAMIAISDTGCGIPAAVGSKVFDPLFTTKPVGKGTGQGLAIARSIVVEKHGGSLTFEPNGARGTTFLISLPSRPGSGAQEPGEV